MSRENKTDNIAAIQHPREKRISLLICIGLIAATIAAYEPIRHNGFINYDDNGYIVDNQVVKSGITWESLGQAFTKPHYKMWHPLTTISHMLDYEFFGLNPTGHHLVSVGIHIVNALLVFGIFRSLGGPIWLSAFIAGVFALHPIQVESVAWAAERKTVLSGLFWLLTMAAYIHYARVPRLSRYLLVVAVFGFCILTKPVVVTLPFALLLLDYWPLERIGGQKTEDKKQNKPISHPSCVGGLAFQKASVGQLIAEKIPLLVMSAILAVITFIEQQGGGAVQTLEKVSLDYRVANMFLSYIRYIGKMLWPSGLAACYPHPHVVLSDSPVVMCMVLFIVLTVLSIYIGWRRRYVAVGWLWYIGTLVPMIGLVQSGGQAMANRYMYISMLGLLIIIGWAIKELVINHPRWRVVAAISAAVILSSAVILTRIQVKYWQSDMMLFEYALKVTENNPIAEYNLGYALFKAGQLDEAKKHYGNAIRMVPGFTDAYNNMGLILMQQKKFDEAVACFNELLKYHNDSAKIYYNMGAALNNQKKYDNAISSFDKALRIDPKYSDARYSMGMAMKAAGRSDEAISCFNEVLKQNGNSVDAHYNLAIVLGSQSKYNEAIKHLAAVLKLAPNHTYAHYKMGLALMSTGKLNEAIECFNDVLKEKKDSAEVYYNLAATLAMQGKYSDAAKHFTTVLRIDPNYPEARYLLGVTLMAVNEPNEAIECFNEVLKQNKNSAAAHNNLAIALEMQGKHDEAIKHFDIVLNLDPNYPDARKKMIASLIAASRTEDAISQLNEIAKTSNNPSAVYANIGALYEKQGNHSLAVQSWNRSLELNPDNIGALNDLAWVLATVDNASVMDAPRAIKLAQHACELTGYKEPSLLDTLGAAYAAAGKFDEAIQKAEQAIEAAKAKRQENLASKIESRLQLYRANQRYRQK